MPKSGTVQCNAKCTKNDPSSAFESHQNFQHPAKMCGNVSKFVRLRLRCLQQTILSYRDYFARDIVLPGTRFPICLSVTLCFLLSIIKTSQNDYWHMRCHELLHNAEKYLTAKSNIVCQKIESTKFIDFEMLLISPRIRELRPLIILKVITSVSIF